MVKVKYLGPSGAISAGNDKFVSAGEEVNLDEKQVAALEALGHRFEGRVVPEVPTEPGHLAAPVGFSAIDGSPIAAEKEEPAAKKE